MRTYQTTETTTLLNYERQSSSRNRVVVGVMYAAVAVTIILAGVFFVELHHHDYSLLDTMDSYPMLGTSQNRQSTLNAGVTTAPSGCEATIMLIRHCDKNGPLIQDDQSDEHCSYVGFQRAHYLSTLFGSRWPIPSKLYALHPGRRGHANYREVETLEPLARKTGVAIDDRFTTHRTRRDADDLFEQLRAGELCGKLVVVSWKHSRMTQLARALGWNDAPSHYPKSSFDQVWQLKYVYQPPVLYDVIDHDEEKEHKVKGKHHKKKAEVELTDKQKKKHDKHMRHMKIASQGWVIYGTVDYQHFDPLSFSYASGDYPDGEGKATGAGWTGTDPEF